jgi:signal transduction histidine kinase
MRFRVEDLPDDADAARQGLLRDMDEMEQMIRSVLHYLGEAGQAGPRETLDLASLVQDVVDDSTFVGHPVSLTDSRPALVEVDAIALRRVLSNLVENAVKYGGVATLRLRTTAGEAVVEVQDAGPGIDAAELEQVFQPFYRTRAAQGTATPGYGLGLAVCRSIARAHGGDVRLRNTLGQGLVAELHLPLVAGAAGAPQTAHQVDTA